MVVSSVARTTAFMHSLGICHRDLKPENVLLRVSGGRFYDVRICDFGLAARVGTAGGPQSMLRDFCGSPGFFAPEILLAQSYCGLKADIWSIGCILLELAIGHKAFFEKWTKAYDAIDSEADFARDIAVAARQVLELVADPVTKSLLSQLLVVDPVHRERLPEVLQHEWFARAARLPGVPSLSPRPSASDPSPRTVSPTDDLAADLMAAALPRPKASSGSSRARSGQMASTPTPPPIVNPGMLRPASPDTPREFSAGPRDFSAGPVLGGPHSRSPPPPTSKGGQRPPLTPSPPPSSSAWGPTPGPSPPAPLASKPVLSARTVEPIAARPARGKGFEVITTRRTSDPPALRGPSSSNVPLPPLAEPMTPNIATARLLIKHDSFTEAALLGAAADHGGSVGSGGGGGSVGSGGGRSPPLPSPRSLSSSR